MVNINCPVKVQIQVERQVLPGRAIKRNFPAQIISLCALAGVRLQDLAEWLEPYRAHSGLVWNKSLCLFHDDFGTLRDTLKIPAGRNGLRRGFVSFHFALNANENLTAAGR